MVPFLSIVTPTLQRESLIEACRSIDNQTGDAPWEHVVMVDQEEFNPVLLDRIRHPRRTVAKCPLPHHDGGNTCRRHAWSLTCGQWVAYMDDDNYYADERVFADLLEVLSPLPKIVQMALFPITRL